MKRAKYILGFLVVTLVLSLASCEDEIERESTHTDASELAVGTFTGTLSFENDSYDNVTVVLTKIDTVAIQAVNINIKAPGFNFDDATGMDLSAKLNVAKANDGFVFSSGFSSTLRLNGRLNNNDLFLKLPIQVRSSNKEVRFHTNGNDWVFIGIKN